MRGPPGNGQRPDTVAQGHGGFTFVSGLLRAACFRELTSVASDRPDVHWGPATWQAGGPAAFPGVLGICAAGGDALDVFQNPTLRRRP